MSEHKKVSQGRDYTVELWRFVFCIVVLGFHFFSKTSYFFFQSRLSGCGIFLPFKRLWHLAVLSEEDGRTEAV